MIQTPEEFLESRGLETATLDRAALIAAFHREMDAGLEGRDSSLRMIPTFVSPYGTVEKDVPVAVLDAGGTNLRGALVTIKSDGTFPLACMERGEMPGATSEVDDETFYETFARHVRRLAAESKSDALGFCFSYPAEASAEGDCKLLMWTKQIKAPGIVGNWVGAELRRHLAAKPGNPLSPNSKMVLLNDTVATLLAGKATESAVRYSAYIGFILGTGTNVAYLEKNANIKKLPDLDRDGVMIINAESGAFDKIKQSEFDKAMDAGCIDTGRSVFEKMIAGVYLGRIGLEVYRAAAKERFFSPGAAERLAKLSTLESMDFDNFCAQIQGKRHNVLDDVFVDEADRVMARRLGTPVFERAAILTAVHLAAFIIKTGGGTNPASPVCVNIDGSTYYKTRTVDFPTVVKAELDALLAPRNVSYALTCVDEAPMVGAAVAALLKN